MVRYFKCLLNKVLQNNSRVRHNIDGFEMELGKGHMLPEYQKNFCMYDKIIPHLAKLSSGGWTIDIGANVGDTVVSMIRHSDAQFLCIEANEEFYSIMKENIEKLPEELKKRIVMQQAFISQKNDENYIMDKSHGTAKKILTSQDVTTPSITLKKCIDDLKIPYDDIKLIKVDTDGFDYECILSMAEALENISPILYWENALEDVSSFKGYVGLVHYLKKMKYDHVFIFDNFGNYLSEGNLLFLENINEYLQRTKVYQTGQRFCYVDVIACKEDKLEIVRDMICDYLEEYPL